jgi:hypothetical protein
MLERIERREKSARIRGVLYSLLPVALTVALLGYTGIERTKGPGAGGCLEKGRIDVHHSD